MADITFQAKGKTPPVLKKDCLLPVAEGGFNLFQQGRRKMTLLAARNACSGLYR